MTLTKFGHSCLLVEIDGARILLDPGHYLNDLSNLNKLDAILITDAHDDHCDVSVVKQLRMQNPEVAIYANEEVGQKLADGDIPSFTLGHGQQTTVKDVLIEGFGTDHAAIHSSLPTTKNTGYRIGQRFFYPGDAYVIPNGPVEILALPTGGPWYKVAETVDYALAVKPRCVLPVHDGMYAKPGHGAKWPVQILGDHGIKAYQPKIGESVTVDFSAALEGK